MTYAPAHKQREQYQRQQILTAPKEKLVQLLFDGVIRFCENGKQAFAAEPVRLEEGCQAVLRAQAIIMELLNTLDRDNGGEVAENLARLHAYAFKLLIGANMERSVAKLDEVQTIYRSLVEAWIGAMNQLRDTNQPAAAAPTPAAAGSSASAPLPAPTAPASRPAVPTAPVAPTYKPAAALGKPGLAARPGVSAMPTTPAPTPAASPLPGVAATMPAKPLAPAANLNRPSAPGLYGAPLRSPTGLARPAVAAAAPAGLSAMPAQPNGAGMAPMRPLSSPEPELEAASATGEGNTPETFEQEGQALAENMRVLRTAMPATPSMPPIAPAKSGVSTPMPRSPRAALAAAAYRAAAPLP